MHWTAKKKPAHVALRDHSSRKAQCEHGSRWKMEIKCHLLPPSAPCAVHFPSQQKYFLLWPKENLASCSKMSINKDQGVEASFWLYVNTSLLKDKNIEASLWLYMDTSLLKPFLQVSSCICPGHSYWPRVYFIPRISSL